jgi:hypothetical protein
MKTCFSIMPFADGFGDIDKIIEKSAEDCGLDYVRSDRRSSPGRVMPQILRDIQQASVIVADITGRNANVFYELGIAHQIKGPDRVIIITQDDCSKAPFDVCDFRQLRYSHNRPGRRALRSHLPHCLKTALESRPEQEMWNVIRGHVQRTQLLVRDLRILLDSTGRKSLDGVRIRIVAGLSSLAISDREPPDPSLDPEYLKQLVEERNLLRRLLVRGARMRAVLNPPRRFPPSMSPERLSARYDRLIALLEGGSDHRRGSVAAREDKLAIKQCEFTLTPVSMPNLFIIDDKVAYEGLKRGGKGGYEMTHCEAGADAVRELVKEFDRLFDESQREMLQTHPRDGRIAEQLRGFYEEAKAAKRRRPRRRDRE